MKLLLVFLALSAIADSHTVVLKRIEGDTQGKEVWMRPYVAPALEFDVEAGEVAPNVPITCKQGFKTREWTEHHDKVVTLECEGGIRLRLVGIDLGQ